MTARRAIAELVLFPLTCTIGLLWCCYHARLMDFTTGSQTVGLVPGQLGNFVRRRWYRFTLDACGSDITVMWMAFLKTPSIRVGRRVTIGPFCFIGECVLQDDVMIGHHSAVQGGGHTHGFGDLSVPMGEQPGSIHAITIGRDVWIGTGARVMADVASGTIVGAGAVVTKTFEPLLILGGVPARPIGRRGPPT